MFTPFYDWRSNKAMLLGYQSTVFSDCQIFESDKGSFKDSTPVSSHWHLQVTGSKEFCIQLHYESQEIRHCLTYNPHVDFVVGSNSVLCCRVVFLVQYPIKDGAQSFSSHEPSVPFTLISPQPQFIFSDLKFLSNVSQF